MSTVEEVARYNMWNRLFEAAGIFDYRDRRNAKRVLLSQWGYERLSDFQPQEEDYTMAGFTNVLTPTYSFDDVVVCTSSTVTYHTLEQEKENNMGDYQIETDQRNYLKRRLDRAEMQKCEDLRTKFHMNFPTFSKPEDLLAFLKAGDGVTVDKTYLNNDGTFLGYINPLGTLKLSDPLKDEAGYKAAVKVKDDAYTAAKDQIMIMPLADGLKALQDFEARVF